MFQEKSETNVKAQRWHKQRGYLGNDRNPFELCQIEIIRPPGQKTHIR